MKRRIRKKLRVKEFQIQEWHVGFKFKYSLQEEEMDEFWDGICNFVNNHKHLYFGGGTCEHQGNFIFLGDCEPKYQVTHEIATEIFKWFESNKYIKFVEMNNTTTQTEDGLELLLRKYEIIPNKENEI